MAALVPRANRSFLHEVVRSAELLEQQLASAPAYGDPTPKGAPSNTAAHAAARPKAAPPKAAPAYAAASPPKAAPAYAASPPSAATPSPVIARAAVARPGLQGVVNDIAAAAVRILSRKGSKIASGG